ncbi:MAG: AAA family ATPase, partial [Propionibacteriales bacterium]|nr:AAA family ATPase [Propionibacteriales bacterium]
MRLHHLAVTAFGPFAGTEQVDFDALSDAGLFLLGGPTGGGKTSVLDAVCFGLFGQVPGDRDKAKRLHSDHAPRGSGPQVVLEATLRGRRVRITRSPEWVRPKLRGTGTTREPAKVLLEEQVDGIWTQRSNRIDESADLLGDLVGVTIGQFCQVALLPQGQFETFLKAGSQERHGLLERLFDAQHYRAIEDWLTEHRKALGQRSAEHEAATTATLARITEVSGATPGDTTGDADLDDPLPWSAGVRDRAVTACAEARLARTESDRAVKLARVQRDEARAVSVLQARHADARRRRERLDALAESTASTQRRVDAARRAEVVAPVASLFDESAAGTEQTRTAAARHAVGAAPWLPTALAESTAAALEDSDPDACDEAAVAECVRLRRQEAARLTALLPTQAELDQAEAALTRTDLQVTATRSRLQQVDDTLARLGDQRDSLVEQARQATDVAADSTALQQRLDAVGQQVDGAQRAEQERDRHADLAKRLAAVTQTTLTAREAWLDVRQARLEGMAAEIALRLQVGEPCPVCGSTEHPDQAQPAGDAVAESDERAAEQLLQHAEQVRAAADADVRRCETALAAAEAAAGGLTLAAAEQARADLRRRVARAVEAGQHAEQVARDLDELDRQVGVQLAARAEAHDELAALQERCGSYRQRRESLRTLLVEAVGTAESLSERVAEESAAERSLQAMVEAVQPWRDAVTRLGELRRRLDETTRRQGFATVAAARAAVVPTAELADLETLLQSRTHEVATVQAVLDDNAVREAAALPRADLDSLEQQLQRLEADRDEAVTRQSRLGGQADRLEMLHSDLDAAIAAWSPTRRALDTARQLAALCAGTSADNPHRIRLSSYVLAARLAQVVDAANERIDRMTGGRYLLEHTDTRGVGDRRGGLGIRVHDGWTGEARDPVTLSGGETFVASLALALGLADVVAYETGGVELGTLFVDEGFGSLDAETLDEVLDVLDDLRSGGRVVGLVSHVPELRARVAAQLRV